MYGQPRVSRSPAGSTAHRCSSICHQTSSHLHVTHPVPHAPPTIAGLPARHHAECTMQNVPCCPASGVSRLHTQQLAAAVYRAPLGTPLPSWPKLKSKLMMWTVLLAYNPQTVLIAVHSHTWLWAAGWAYLVKNKWLFKKTMFVLGTDREYFKYFPKDICIQGCESYEYEHCVFKAVLICSGELKRGLSC